MIRLLIAEDQAMFRTAIRRLLELEADLQVVAEVSRGDEVLEAARRSEAGVALVDIELPGSDGLTAVADLTRELPSCRALVVTTFGRPGFLHDEDWSAPLDGSELYGPLRHRRFPHRVDETIEETVGTISYVGAMDEAERRAFLDEVRRMCAGFGVDSSLPAPMPYVTVVYLTRAC